MLLDLWPLLDEPDVEAPDGGGRSPQPLHRPLRFETRRHRVRLLIRTQAVLAVEGRWSVELEVRPQAELGMHLGRHLPETHPTLRTLTAVTRHQSDRSARTSHLVRDRTAAEEEDLVAVLLALD